MYFKRKDSANLQVKKSLKTNLIIINILIFTSDMQDRVNAVPFFNKFYFYSFYKKNHVLNEIFQITNLTFSSEVGKWQLQNF
jgi:hypothetical protein